MTKKTVKAVLFDLDGTIYLGGRMIPGAAELLRQLRAHGIAYGFMTNNSSIGPDDYLRKLQGLGIAVTAEQVISSAEAAVLMLADRRWGPDLYILGTQELIAYLGAQGYRHTADNPSAVLVAFDKELTFEKLTTAVRLVQAGVPLAATHPDVCCPSPEGDLVDAGALLAALYAATGVKPDAIAGKPHRWIVALARRNFGVPTRQIAVVGDRLQTDIRLGRRFGMTTVLTLTGVTDRAALEKSRVKPDIVVESVAELADPERLRALGWL